MTIIAIFRVFCTVLNGRWLVVRLQPTIRLSMRVIARVPDQLVDTRWFPTFVIAIFRVFRAVANFNEFGVNVLEKLEVLGREAS